MQMNSFPDFAMDGVRESRLFFRISGKEKTPLIMITDIMASSETYITVSTKEKAAFLFWFCLMSIKVGDYS
jgi:hypothetical protein